MSKEIEEANKLRDEAKRHLNGLLGIPTGYSNGTSERLVDCLIGAALLEVSAIMKDAILNQGSNDETES